MDLTNRSTGKFVPFVCFTVVEQSNRVTGFHSRTENRTIRKLGISEDHVFHILCKGDEHDLTVGSFTREDYSHFIQWTLRGNDNPRSNSSNLDFVAYFRIDNSNTF